MVLHYNSPKRSYCHQCEEPKVVVEIRLRGWDHSFLLCRKCLEAIEEVPKKAEAEFRLESLKDNGNEKKD